MLRMLILFFGFLVSFSAGDFFKAFYNKNDHDFNKAVDELFDILDDDNNLEIIENEIKQFWIKFNSTAEYHDQMLKSKDVLWHQLKKYDTNNDDVVTQTEFKQGTQTIKNIKYKIDQSICEHVRNYTDFCDFENNNHTGLFLLKERVRYENFLCNSGISGLFNYQKEVCVLNSESCSVVSLCYDEVPRNLLLDPQTNMIMKNYNPYPRALLVLIGILHGIGDILFQSVVTVGTLLFLFPFYFKPWRNSSNN